MTEREHTSKSFEQQLRTLKDRLLLMGHHAEKMIADSMHALVERRPSLAEAPFVSLLAPTARYWSSPLKKK